VQVGYDCLTVDDLLAEPFVQELMRADHVDPDMFAALMCSVAAYPPGRAAADDPPSSGVGRLRSMACVAALMGLLPRRRQAQS
jgi:hypothetical protein